MRAIRTAVKCLVVVVAVMAVPAVAAATPAEWTEYDGTPIDTVTADISGYIDLTISSYIQITAHCEVTGEIELSNDGPGATATQRIVSLQPVDADPYGPYVCDGNWLGYPVSQATYHTPWSGATTYEQYWGYVSTLDDFQMTTEWGGPNGWTQSTTGSIPMADYEVEVGSDYCIGILETWGPTEVQTGSYSNSHVEASLEFDLDTLDGLSTNEGGPCVKLADA
jgi:hypothetical protein